MPTDLTTTGVALTALLASAIHAALPNHWLPFVLVGRHQGWSRHRTFGLLVLGALAHIIATVVLGVVAAKLGVELSGVVEEIALPFASGILVLFGIYMMVRELAARGHGHHHHDHPPSPAAAAVPLVLSAFLAPCETVLPLFFAAGPLGTETIVVVTLTFSLGSFVGIAALGAVSLYGFEKLKLDWLESWEGALVGAVLIALGAALAVLH